MKNVQTTGLIVAGVLIASLYTPPAQAQFGFGAGSWGGHFGSWIEFWPGYYPRYRPRSAPRKSEPPVQSNGYLQGRVTVRSACPEAQSSATCPVSTLRNLTVVAQPSNSSQWLSTKADRKGYFQLALPPGNYTLGLQHPNVGQIAQFNRQVTIQAGQTNQQNYEIDLPAN